MPTRDARITVTRGGRAQLLPQGADLLREVSRLLQTYADTSDVTISIKLPADQGTLLVAIDTGKVFVGLEAPDGIYQYLADGAAEGKCNFVIGDQSTPIDARYVLTVPAAIVLMSACLGGPGPFTAPAWERQ